MPDRNTIRYTVDVDYGMPGRYRSENLVSASAGMATMSVLVGDVAAPIAGMAAGPQGPIYPKTIKAEITLTADMHLAKILDAKLLTPTVHTGETAQIGVRYQGADNKVFTRSYTMPIPTTAASGRYRLTAGSWQQHLTKLRAEQPDRFDPHSLADMMELFNPRRRHAPGPSLPAAGAAGWGGLDARRPGHAQPARLLGEGPGGLRRFGGQTRLRRGPPSSRSPWSSPSAAQPTSS